MGRNIIIFDLDGLLVDTEKIFYQAFKSIAKGYGHQPSFSEYVSSVVSAGIGISDVMNLDKLKAREFENRVYERYEYLLRQNLSIRRGAIDCLKRLRKYHLILVTSSKKEYVDYNLESLTINRYFEKIITRDDNFPLKPNPDIFQYIQKSFQKDAWECLVIEDSKRGITAALSIGMPCVIIPNEYTYNEDYGPRVRRFRSLNNIDEQVVENIFKSACPKEDHTLVNLYRDSVARLTDIFKIYRDLYGLEKITHVDKNVTTEAFEYAKKRSFFYAKKRSFFVILAMLTKDGRIYLQRSFDTGHLTMLLPGYGIHLDQEESILHAIKRLAEGILKNAQIADLSPVVYLNNVFECNDGRIVEHTGLGVRALLLNDESEIAEYSSDIAVKGSFIKGFPPNEIPQPPSRETFERVVKWFNSKDYSTYFNEIFTQHEVMQRYVFHQYFVNPIFKGVSYILGKYSIAGVKQNIVNIIGNSNSCLDVACGNDKGIFQILKNVPLVVANDISIDQIRFMESEYNKFHKHLPKAHTILFTNHDCLDLPFRNNAFDIALCRNLLHHITSADDLKALLDNLERVAKRILIVEIHDPSKENLWSKIRHLYYMKFLRDEGRHFYDKVDFEKILSSRFNSKNVKFSYFPTIRGEYMFAEVNST